MSKPKWCRAPGPIELSTLITGGQLERERERQRKRKNKNGSLRKDRTLYVN